MRTNKINESQAAQGIKPGDKITVTKRKTTASVQANVQEGHVYTVKEVTQTPTGIPCLVCTEPGDGGREVRINAARFDWMKIKSVPSKKGLTPHDKRGLRLGMIQKYAKNLLTGEGVDPEITSEIERMVMANQTDEEIYQYLHNAYGRVNVKRYLLGLSETERKQRLNIPVALGEMAWYWATKARRQCAEKKIDEMKQIARHFDQTRKEYSEGLEKITGHKAFVTLMEDTKAAAETDETMAINFTRAYHSISNGLHKKYGDIEYLELTIYANISMMVIWAYEKFCDQQDKHIVATTKDTTLQMRRDKNITIKLKSYADAMRGDFTLDTKDDINVQNAANTLINHFWACEFGIRQND